MLTTFHFGPPRLYKFITQLSYREWDLSMSICYVQSLHSIFEIVEYLRTGMAMLLPQAMIALLYMYSH